MPSQHASNPIPFRPPKTLRARLRDHAIATGQAVNAVLTKAVTEYLDKHDPQSSKEQGK